MKRRVVFALRSCALVATLGAPAPLLLRAQQPPSPPIADLVILNGRVMDPESGLDAVRHVAVGRGVITAVTAVTRQAPRGRDTIDAKGLVVAPGFIDLHQHAQDSIAYTVLVRGGTTSAFELEEGTGDVAAWYRSREGRAAVHHGVAAGHAAVRSRVLGDTVAARGGAAPRGDAAKRAATDTELAQIRAGIEQGLRDGAVAVGLILGYTPGARPWEVLEVFRAAAAHRASVHVHVRELDEPLWYLEVLELIGASAATGAPAQLVHINSSMQEDAPKVLELLRGARRRGLDVTTEAYPYATAMTGIEAAMFDNWATWPDERFRRYEWVETGERLTRETFGRYRARGGLVAIHPPDSLGGEGWVRAALGDSLTMIASDGVLEGGRGHPRVAATPARVLGRYVREAHVMTLMQALRRLTLDPARRLEARAPAMRRKGRVRVGADADLVVFDPATVTDRATFAAPTAPPAGVPYVVVGGEVVVRRGELVAGRLAGRGIRAR